VQEISRERDKDYQKLKTQLDKYKRKALLSQNTAMATAAAAQDQLMDEPPPSLQGMSQQPMFGGPNGILATPSRRQQGFQADLQNTIHASRQRLHRLNPTQPQYPGHPNHNMSPSQVQHTHHMMGYAGRPHRSSGARHAQPLQSGPVQAMPFPAPVRTSHHRSNVYQGAFPG